MAKGNDDETDGGVSGNFSYILKEKIKALENSKAPLVYFFLTFFFAVSIRNFLEAVLYGHFYQMGQMLDLETILHFSSYYLTIILAITIIF